MTSRFKPRIDFTPEALEKVASRLNGQGGRAGSALPPADRMKGYVEELLEDFGSLLKGKALSKWAGRKRRIKKILLCISLHGLAELDYLSDMDIRKTGIALSKLLKWRKTSLAGLYGYLGRACLNNPGLDVLWQTFGDIIKKYSGRNRDANIWKNNFLLLRNPEAIVERAFRKGVNVETVLRQTATANTVTGDMVLMGWLKRTPELGREELTKLLPMLIGGFRGEDLPREQMGMLARLPIEKLAVFVNAYLGSRRAFSQEDLILRYFRSRMILGSPRTDSRWAIDEIEPRARRKMISWILSKDFEIAFDRILKHKERKSYWKKWLDAGRIEKIRVFAPNPRRLNKTLKLDTSVDYLEYPTMFMKIGSAICIECGARGMGGVYIYPEDGPIDWNMELRYARRYKAPVLDSWSSIDHRSATIVHSGYWQAKVNIFLDEHYGLRLP